MQDRCVCSPLHVIKRICKSILCPIWLHGQYDLMLLIFFFLIEVVCIPATKWCDVIASGLLYQSPTKPIESFAGLYDQPAEALCGFVCAYLTEKLNVYKKTCHADFMTKNWMIKWPPLALLLSCFQQKAVDAWSARLGRGQHAEKKSLLSIIIFRIPLEPGLAQSGQLIVGNGPLLADSGLQENKSKYNSHDHQEKYNQKSFGHTF